jgi:hypothetical protein
LISGADDAGTKVAKKLSFQAIGLSCQDAAKQKLVSINMHDIDEPHEDSELNLHVTLNYGIRSQKKLDYAGHSVTIQEIYCNSPFSICSEPKVGRYWLKYWLGDDSANVYVGASCIAFNPPSTKGGKKKLRLKKVLHWKTPKIELPKVRKDEPKTQPTSKGKSGAQKIRWFAGTKKEDNILDQQKRLRSEPEPIRSDSGKTVQSVQEQQERLGSERKKPNATAPSPDPIQISAGTSSEPQPKSSQKDANKHGIDGRDLKKLIEHQSFTDFLREHEKEVGW